MHVNDGREVEFSKEREREREPKVQKMSSYSCQKTRTFASKDRRRIHEKRKKEKEDALLSWRNYNSSRHPSFFSHASFFHWAKIRKLRTKLQECIKEEPK